MYVRSALGIATGVISSPRFLGQPAAPTFTAAERLTVDTLIAQEIRDENVLTNRVYFQRHPAQTGTKLKAGSSGANEWLAILTGLVRPALSAVQMNIPGRACCLLAPETPFGSTVADPTNLGEHKKTTEVNGIIYTGCAGFVDISHLRETCDITEFVWTRLQGAGGRPSTIPTFQGEATITRPVPRQKWLTVAQAVAFDDALGHEIATYDVFVPGGHNSAFSPEDLCSNFIGTAVARLAIRAGGAFSSTVDVKLPRVLTALGAQTPAETRKAFDRIKSRWVSFTGPNSVSASTYLRRRNFSRRPFKTGHSSDKPTPAWVLRGFGDATTFYSYSHTAGRTIPKSTWPAELKKIRADAKTRYGADFDKP